MGGDDYWARNSRKMYWPIYFMVVILGLIVMYVQITGRPLNFLALGGVVGFAGLGFCLSEIHRIRTYYQITPYFLVHSNGLFYKNVKKFALASVSHMVLEQNPWQRMLGFGSVHVHLFSENLVPVRNINNPDKFIELLTQNMSKNSQNVSPKTTS